MEVRDNVFVVTGAGNGIGRQVVLELLRRGGRVAAADRDRAGLVETERLAGAADRLSLHEIDLAVPAAVDRLATDVQAAHGRVDGVLNVAGIIQPFVTVADLELADIEKVMAVNFWAVVHVTRAFLPLLRQRPAAALVNVSSMGAFVAVPGQTAYGASKAAVKLFTEGLYAELHGTPVAVTAVYPGAIATDIAAHSGVHVNIGSDSPPMSMTSAEQAAREIVDGLEKGAYRVVIGRDARSLDRLSRLAPRRATELVARRMRSLLGG